MIVAYSKESTFVKLRVHTKLFVVSEPGRSTSPLNQIVCPFIASRVPITYCPLLKTMQLTLNNWGGGGLVPQQSQRRSEEDTEIVTAT